MSSPRLCCLVVLAAGAASAQTELTAEAAARYRDAVSKVTAGDHATATIQLNALAAEFPRVAEIFATRCSAQLGLKAMATAEADCRYAYTLKPSLTSALYGLAMAEEGLGRNDAAMQHYQQYIAGTDAPFRAQAQARVNALSAPLPVAAPPVPVLPEAKPSTLVVYRNHFFNGSNSQVTLLVDDKEIGDIGHDQYVEIQLAPGEHIVEACIGGIRYARAPGALLEINTGNNGEFRGVTLGGGKSQRLRGMTLPVDVPSSGNAYVNFDTVAGRLSLVNVPPQRATAEIASDCTRAYSRKM